MLRLQPDVARRGTEGVDDHADQEVQEHIFSQQFVTLASPRGIAKSASDVAYYCNQYVVRKTIRENCHRQPKRVPAIAVVSILKLLGAEWGRHSCDHPQRHGVIPTMSNTRETHRPGIRIADSEICTQLCLVLDSDFEASQD
eukprot:988892-Rhodomonas_salina.5